MGQGPPGPSACAGHPRSCTCGPWRRGSDPVSRGTNRKIDGPRGPGGRGGVDQGSRGGAPTSRPCVAREHGCRHEPVAEPGLDCRRRSSASGNSAARRRAEAAPTRSPPLAQDPTHADAGRPSTPPAPSILELWRPGCPVSELCEAPQLQDRGIPGIVREGWERREVGQRMRQLSPAEGARRRPRRCMPSRPTARTPAASSAVVTPVGTLGPPALPEARTMPFCES